MNNFYIHADDPYNIIYYITLYYITSYDTYKDRIFGRDVILDRRRKALHTYKHTHGVQWIISVRRPSILLPLACQLSKTHMCSHRVSGPYRFRGFFCRLGLEIERMREKNRERMREGGKRDTHVVCVTLTCPSASHHHPRTKHEGQ